MGGKTATTTQQVKIPPEVMARYNAVNKRAEQVATQEFQKYSTDPNAFVAPLTGTQNAAMQQMYNIQGMSQPYYQAAAGYTAGGAQGVGPLTQEQIAYYQNPYTQAVADPTYRALLQQQQEQMQGATGSAIKSGAFGGDRSGLVAANLARQQELGMAQSMAPIYQQGYQQAVQTAAGQQGIQQQNLARMLQAGQQMGGLGAGAMQTALQGAQGLFGMGSAEQQTQQAGLQALYNQFQQERGYPFQIAQFLANIAMGTGALSGSTTTTTQPTSFFSDRRLKENMRRVGQSDDGLPIYAFNYKGRPGETQIGFDADEVQHAKPEAVGLAGGFKTVDYDRATRPESMGGAVHNFGAEDHRENFADGGMPDYARSLAQMYAMFSPQGQQDGLGVGMGMYGGKSSWVPKGVLPVSSLMTAGKAPTAAKSGMASMMEDARNAAAVGNTISDLYTGGEKAVKFAKGLGAGAAPAGAPLDITNETNEERVKNPLYASGGLVRGGYDLGGSTPYGSADDPLNEVVKEGSQAQHSLPKPGEAPKVPGGLGSELKDLAGTVSAAKTLGGLLPSSLTSGISSAASGLGAAATEGLGALGTGIGAAAGGIGEGIMAALPFLALSDERAKHDKQKVGELYDGQPVYRFKYDGEDKTRIGLMAQDVERHGHRDAVHDVDGIKMLDYKRATDGAAGLAPRQHFAFGGLGTSIANAVEDANPVEEAGISQQEKDALWSRMVKQESGGNQFDRSGRVLESPKGALGAAQVMPDTAPEAAKLAGLPYDENRYRTDKEYNLALGRAYYNKQLEDFGTPKLAAAAYNAGPGRVAQALKQAERTGRPVEDFLPAETRDYIASTVPGSAVERTRTASAAGVSPEEKSSGLRPPASFKTGQPQSWGDFLTSKQFVVPLLTGLGTMAASPSLYAGSAILQGLGAGAKSYSDLERREAELGQVKAQTGLTSAETEIAKVRAQGAAIRDNQGRVEILVYDKSGNPRWVSYYDEYKKNPDQYKLFAETGKTPYEAKPLTAPVTKVETKELPPGGAGAGTTTGAESTGAAGKTAEAAPAAKSPFGGLPAEKPATPVGPKYGTDPIVLSDEIRQRAISEGKGMESTPESTFATRKDIVAEQNAAAKAASDEKRTLLEIGVLGSTPKSALMGQGALQPYTFNLGRMANAIFGGEVVSAKDIGDYEAWNKKLVELSDAAARRGDQTASASLDKLRGMYPSPELSQKGFAKNTAEVLISRQIEMDRANFYKQYENVVKGQTSRFFNRFDPDVKSVFDKEYGGVYTRDRQALEKMLDPTKGPMDPASVDKVTGKPTRPMMDDSGRPMSWFTFIQKNSGRLSPQYVTEIEKKFGAPGVLRYFQSGMGG